MTTLSATLLAVAAMAAAAPPSTDTAAPPEPSAPAGATSGFSTPPSDGSTADPAPAFAPVDTPPRDDGEAKTPSEIDSAPASAEPVPEPQTDAASDPAPRSAAVGMGQTAPLPPPPPPLDPASIQKGPWRGRGYLALRVSITGPVGGDQPAKTNVVAWGGGVEVGYRFNNWVALGIGVEGQPHRRIERVVTIDGTNYTQLADASLTNWDFGVVRFFYPLDGRVQPFVDLSGGMSVLGPLPGEDRRVGGQGRASLGMDAWVSRNLSLELAVDYRINALDASIGHMLQGRFGLTIHW